MRFLTLIDLEIKKITAFLVSVLGIGLLGHVALFTRQTLKLNKQIGLNAMEAGVPIAEYVKTAPKVNFSAVFDSFPLVILLFLFIAFALIGFVGVMWYREWFGTSKRIYTLLTLKGSRFKIFASKLITFIFSYFSYLGMILLALSADAIILKTILPSGMVSDHLIKNAILNSFSLKLVFPNTLYSLLYTTLFMVMIFSIASAAILLNRSFRIKGLVAGIIYGVGTIALFVYTKTLFLYTYERTLVDLTYVVLITLISTLFAHYLLKKKVTI